MYDVRDGFVRRDVCIKDAVISQSEDGPVYDLSGCVIVPGLTELRESGVSAGESPDFQAMADRAVSRGVTQFCPVLPSGADLEEVCARAKTHRRESRRGAVLCALHLDATAEKSVDPAALLELHRQSGGLLRLVTLSLRTAGLSQVIPVLSEELTVSLAHEGGGYEAARQAFGAGARQAAQGFRETPAVSYRDPGVMGAAFDAPDVKVELVCDGEEIHPCMVRWAFQLFGPKRVILTSASGGLAEDVKRAVSYGVPLAQAVRAAAVNPAKAIGIYSRVGSIETGKLANLAILDENLDLRAVLVCGSLAWGSLC